jgi:L-iditol 2-dehydrogenase
MGHEAAGVITGVGAQVKGFAPGDRVTFDSTVFCGECVHCKRGDVNLCDNRQVLGVSCGDYRRHGAFAEFVTVPARILHKLPAALGFAEAAMIEAVSVGVHAVRLTPVAPGDTAIVVGTGMIGLLTLQAAKLAGFAQVIAVDTEDSRLAVAQELGATHRFNPKTGGDLTEYVKSLTQGQGADAAFECVGLNATVLSAIDAVRKGGTVNARRQPLAQDRAPAPGRRHAPAAPAGLAAPPPARSRAASSCSPPGRSWSTRSSPPSLRSSRVPTGSPSSTPARRASRRSSSRLNPDP